MSRLRSSKERRDFWWLTASGSRRRPMIFVARWTRRRGTLRENNRCRDCSPSRRTSSQPSRLYCTCSSRDRSATTTVHDIQSMWWSGGLFPHLSSVITCSPVRQDSRMKGNCASRTCHDLKSEASCRCYMRLYWDDKATADVQPGLSHHAPTQTEPIPPPPTQTAAMFQFQVEQVLAACYLQSTVLVKMVMKKGLTSSRLKVPTNVASWQVKIHLTGV